MDWSDPEPTIASNSFRLHFSQRLIFFLQESFLRTSLGVGQAAYDN